LKGPETVRPVSASQTKIVLSAEPDAMNLPSGENEADRTELVWPLKMFRMAA